jgi:hypothetical protein
MPSGSSTNSSALLRGTTLAAQGGADPATLGASSLFLATLRDLKLVNSHLASIGYAVLGPGERNGLRVSAMAGIDEVEG